MLKYPGTFVCTRLKKIVKDDYTQLGLIDVHIISQVFFEEPLKPCMDQWAELLMTSERTLQRRLRSLVKLEFIEKANGAYAIGPEGTKLCRKAKMEKLLPPHEPDGLLQYLDDADERPGAGDLTPTREPDTTPLFLVPQRALYAVARGDLEPEDITVLCLVYEFEQQAIYPHQLDEMAGCRAKDSLRRLINEKLIGCRVNTQDFDLYKFWVAQ